MKILAIDTSCDETSVAVTQGLRVLSNVVSSQIRYHKKFGGVVPFLAQRLHAERIDSVIALALQRARCTWDDIGAIAVTQGPGLAPALEVGIAKAKELAVAHGKPLYPVNHMAGHLAAVFLQSGSSPAPKPAESFPLLAFLVSGGHTELVLVPRWGQFDLIGETLDDAVGEAYDKVAKMLGLGYPGGAVIARLAESGNPEAFDLPIPMQNHKGYDFSYSGLKNAVRLLIASLEEKEELNASSIADLCASFERVAQASLLQKLEKALQNYPEAKIIALGGGVASNTALRRKVRTVARKYGVTVAIPATKKLCTDNGAMIGAAAWLDMEAGVQPALVDAVDRKPGLVISDASLGIFTD